MPYNNLPSGNQYNYGSGTKFWMNMVVYPFYGDKATGASPAWYTPAQNLAKSLFAAGFGQKIKATGLAFGSSGCSYQGASNCGLSNQAGAWQMDASNNGGLEVHNSSLFRASDDSGVAFNVYTRPSSCFPYIGVLVTNNTLGNHCVNANYANDIGRSYGTTFLSGWTGHDSHVFFNYTVLTYSDSDKFFLQLKRQITSSDGVTNLYDQVKLNIQPAIVTPLNSTFYSFRYRDIPSTIAGSPNSWISIVIGYRSASFNGSTVTWPTAGGNQSVTVYFDKNTVQQTMTTGTKSIRLMLWPAWGNITSAAQITAIHSAYPIQYTRVGYSRPFTNLTSSVTPFASFEDLLWQKVFPAHLTGSANSWTAQLTTPKSGSYNLYLIWDKTAGGGSVKNIGGATLNSVVALTPTLDNVSYTVSLVRGSATSVVFYTSPATLVSQAITVTMDNAAPSRIVTIGSCSTGGNTTFLSDGFTHTYPAFAGSCNFTLTLSNSGSTRDGFAVGGGFATTSSAYPSGTPLRVTAYEQVQNTATFNANAQIAFDSGMTCAVTGTNAGVSGSILASLTSTGASAISVVYWSDYKAPASLCASMSGAPLNSRWQAAGPISFTDTSGGNTHAVQYWKQLINTYQASPTSNGNKWDAPLFIMVMGQQLGSIGQTGCIVSTSGGGGAASCSSYFDYGTSVTVGSVVVSATEIWTQTGGNAFTQFVGGNVDNLYYVRQWQITIAQAPSNCGSSTPGAGIVWETDGTTFAISGTPAPGCSFSSWSSTAGISIGSATQASTMATANAAGTITVAFARTQ
jgi:hypothetical protein